MARRPNLGHTLRRGEDDISRAVLNWKPNGLRTRGWARKIWSEIVEEILDKMAVQKWKALVQNREK